MDKKHSKKKNLCLTKIVLSAFAILKMKSVIFTDKIASKKGKVSEYPRRFPKLKNDAFPKLFLNLPKHLTKLTQKRNVTVERKKKMEKLEDDDLNRFLEANKINFIIEIEDELNKEKKKLHE